MTESPSVGPKVELHLHLEGAIPLPALWALTQKYGQLYETGPATQGDLEARFVYTDFPHFLEIWHWKNQFIREEEDFVYIAEQFAHSLLEQNIVYAEAFFSPTDFAKTGLSIGQIAHALRRGLDKVEAVEVALIADLVRDNGPDKAARVLDEVSEVREAGIIGVGIGGSEHKYPASLFPAVFKRARELGLHTTAHAGEADGANSVKDAINLLRVERIGHGTRAIESEAVMTLIELSGVHIEACPTSNVRTQVSKSIATHPIRTFLDRGFKVSVNTDDPVMFNCSMDSEYQVLKEAGFRSTDIHQLRLNAIEGAWCSHQQKQKLRELVAQTQQRAQ